MLMRFGIVVSLDSAALTMVIGRLRVATFAVPFCRVHEGNIRATDPYIILFGVLPDKHLRARFPASVPACGDGAGHQAAKIHGVETALLRSLLAEGASFRG